MQMQLFRKVPSAGVADVRAVSISRSSPAFVLASLGPIALFLVALILTAQARGVPDNDYWDMFSAMVTSLDEIPALSDLYTRSNEHIVAGAKLFYLLNFHLTNGDNFGLSAIASIFSLLIAVVFSCALSFSIHSRFEAFVIGLAVSLFRLQSPSCTQLLSWHERCSLDWRGSLHGAGCIGFLAIGRT